MKYLNFILIMLFTFSISSCINSREYEMLKFENENNDIFYIGCIVQDKLSLDTLLSITIFDCFLENNYYIYKDNFFWFLRLYEGSYNPPKSELMIERFNILTDTIIGKDSYNFGNYNSLVSSKFEGNLLTIFNGDSIIEFDLDKFEEIKRYKNVNFNMRKQ